MTEQSTNDNNNAGEIRFVDNYVPTLAAGDYTIEVTQSLKGSGAFAVDALFKETQQFIVRGPRFCLDPSDFYGMYPPPNSQGNFGNDLPHIILTKRALPWERKLVGDEPVPWMALVLFDESEILPPVAGANTSLTGVTTMTVEELLDSTKTDPATFHAYTRELLKKEPVDESELALSCQVIEISPSVFQAVMPSKDAARYLAHCREVTISSKALSEPAQSQDSPAPGSGKAWYSVVVCGRFPGPAVSSQESKRKVVHLVSLEGLENYLPVESPVSDPPLSGYERIRLVSLASWTFTCLPEKGESFRELMLGLVEGERAKQLEFRLPASEPGPGATAESKYAFKMVESGYVPFGYQMRQGVRAFAWYRGPFTPQPVKRFPAGHKPFVSSAQAMYYDQDHGLFDLSYAVAWETGRLMALSDQRFGIAMLNWQREAHRLIDKLYEESKASGNGSGMAALYQDENTQRLLRQESGEDLDLIYDWLAHLYLLYGVPFTNLVPEERLLQPESIRFFYLDRNWLEAMLDGALSIGIQSSRELLHRNAVYGFIHDGLSERIPSLRHRLLDGEAESPGETSQGTLAGLLLRSAVVPGWPGLEVRAYSSSDGMQGSGRVGLLRMDHPAQDILLCLFDRVPAWIEFDEPKEGLHFGITEAEKLECDPHQKLNIKARLEKIIKKHPGLRIEEVGPAAFALGMVKQPEQMVFQRAG